jgi:hypothetical protein
MLIYPEKVKVNLNKIAQRIEQKDPERGRLHKQRRRKERHFSHFQTLKLRDRVVYFKRTFVEISTVGK